MNVRDYPQMKIRIPPELKDALEQSASASNRTMNAEIISRLQESITADDGVGGSDGGQFATLNDVRRIAAEVFQELSKQPK